MTDPGNGTTLHTDRTNDNSIERNDGIDTNVRQRHLRATRKTVISEKNDVINNNNNNNYGNHDGPQNGDMHDYNQFNRASREFITVPTTTTASPIDSSRPVDNPYAYPSSGSSYPLVTLTEPTTTTTTDGPPSKPLSCERLLSGGSSVSWLLLSDCCVVNNNTTITTATTNTTSNRTVATTNDDRDDSDSYLWSPSYDIDHSGEPRH